MPAPDLRAASRNAASVLSPAASASFDDGLTLIVNARGRDDLARGLARVLCVWRAERDRVGIERERPLRRAVRDVCDHVAACDRVAHDIAANEAGA